ncbi:MAG: hypothetical protein RLZZ621_796, partial [Gemmatimonadota bacterium]
MTDVLHILESAQSLLEDGHVHEAVAGFRRVYELLPAEISVTTLLANALRVSGDTPGERAVWIEAAARLSGDSGAIDYQIGTGLLTTGAPFESIPLLERVAKARPADSAAVGALASAYRATGRLELAWAQVQRALKISPRSATLLFTAAQIRHSQGSLTEALRLLDKVVRIRPDHPPTRLQRGLTYLLAGNLAAGWADFEFRGLPTCETSAKAWCGESLVGGSIAVIAEQGLGDLFHFIRFVPLLHTAGASRVVVQAPEGTLRLLRQSGFEAVTKDALPATDWFVPLLSLPYRLGITNPSDLGETPYLSTGSAPQRPRSSGRPRVGLAWKGNPAFLATSLRDLDAETLDAILQIRTVDWVSLQYGVELPGSCESKAPLGPTTDWLDTARAIEQLDAVVSVDTSIAHLAGAIGRPVFILLPFTPDWRWGL